MTGTVSVSSFLGIWIAYSSLFVHTKQQLQQQQIASSTANSAGTQLDSFSPLPYPLSPLFPFLSVSDQMSSHGPPSRETPTEILIKLPRAMHTRIRLIHSLVPQPQPVAHETRLSFSSVLVRFSHESIERNGVHWQHLRLRCESVTTS